MHKIIWRKLSSILPGSRPVILRPAHPVKKVRSFDKRKLGSKPKTIEGKNTMCGIAGIIDLLGNGRARRNRQKMAQALVHRGPDEEGFFGDPGWHWPRAG